MYLKQRQKWIQPPGNMRMSIPFIRALPLKQLQDGNIQYEAMTDRGAILLNVNPNQSFQATKGQDYDDMCEMNVLNEPQVLHNIVSRYRKDQIFTNIGPTLIVLNPYRKLDKLFNQEVLLTIREKILMNAFRNEKPHIFVIAGKAFILMKESSQKQAIVISGESGAGKTQSTKYCMQLLTTLNQKKNHSLEEKILSCNPLLEAFGNSKTVRNDNSSRFGKFVQIFFKEDNTINGANIRSYLLEKSRVVSIAMNQRSFHVFYALTSSGMYDTKEANHYTFLKQSNCFKAANIDDKKYYFQICEAFKSIGFSKDQEDKIWNLLSSILKLGNVDFDDANQYADESKPCSISNAKTLHKIAEHLMIEPRHLEKILLFQKKKFLKEFTLSAYNKQNCRNNRNTLCKAIYNVIFEFILTKIQTTLLPKNVGNANLKQINILDIFGFQNFQENSFEQLCINFTNEKLLKLYNSYIFQRQMQILKEDGLQKEIASIKPPTNDDVINIICGKLSLFSITNDLTLPNQFKDHDIIQSFESKLKNPQILEFNKIDKTKFIITHTQCSVCYNINGFKAKNQDKVNEEILDVISCLFSNTNKQISGKTILTKFSKEIDDLITELNSSSVHFIRCIKPNQKKIPNFPQEMYILTQIRYLGVFQTILIRKKTFPARKTYKQFYKLYKMLFPQIKDKNEKVVTQKILKELTKNESDYLLGRERVYMNSAIQEKLNIQIFKFLKLRNQKMRKIQLSVKKFLYRRSVLSHLHLLFKRIQFLKKIPSIYDKFTCIHPFKLLLLNSQDKKLEQQREKQEQRKLAMLQAKRIRDQERKQMQKLQKQHKNENIKILIRLLETFFQKKPISQAFKLIRQTKKPKFSLSLNFDDSKYFTKSANDTLDVSDSVIDRHSPYKKPQTPSSAMTNKQFYFQNQFLKQINTPLPTYLGKGVLFTDSVQIQPKKQNSFNPNLSKLQAILAQKYKIQVQGNEQDFFSPLSSDCNFKLQDLSSAMLNKIIAFPVNDFFNKYLRKRTTFIGTKKTYEEILVYKKAPLSKSMTILTSQDQQKRALSIFKLILKIGEQHKIEAVLKHIDKFIQECSNSSKELRNQVFVQLIRQSNSISELSCIRIYQAITVFIHVYAPQDDFMIAFLHMLFLKLSGDKCTPTELQFIKYVFRKIVRKLQKKTIIGYTPINYQMMGLMCKRQICLPVYLPTGNSILIKVQSYHTFGEIKQTCLRQFGIDYQRFKPQLFTFFQIINFQSEQLQQTPIKESNVIWDMMTYWQITKNKYQQTGITPPNFFLMLKIRFSFQCHQNDEQSVQLCFAQCYFDYFMGRIVLEIENMVMLASYIKKIRYEGRTVQQILMGILPFWITKKMKKENIIELLNQCTEYIDKQNLSNLQAKFKFIELCSESPIALAMAIPTEQPIKIFLKPKKLLLVEKDKVVDEFPIKHIVKWWIDKEKFSFEAMEKEGKAENKTHVVMTEYSSVCNEYLNLVSQILIAPSFKKK